VRGPRNAKASPLAKFVWPPVPFCLKFCFVKNSTFVLVSSSLASLYLKCNRIEKFFFVGFVNIYICMKRRQRTNDFQDHWGIY
jgi:hypothetical protein